VQTLGHERFKSIDRIENNGLSLTGEFHSDQRGEFRTYFRFHLSAHGKIERLEIGQALSMQTAASTPCGTRER
jgi:hypothetical protein